MRRARKHIKEGGAGSTDSEDPAGIKGTCEKKKRKGQGNHKDRGGKTAGNKRGEGQASKDADILKRSAVAGKHKDQASSVRREQRATCNGTAPRVEQPRPSTTGKVLGKDGFIQ